MNMHFWAEPGKHCASLLRVAPPAGAQTFAPPAIHLPRVITQVSGLCVSCGAKAPASGGGGVQSWCPLGTKVHEAGLSTH